MISTVTQRIGLTAKPGSGTLLAAMYINAFGAGMFVPFAILYFKAATTLSTASIGLALTSATLVTLTISPITGALVDRLGARPLVVTSQCLEAIGYATYVTVSSAYSLFAITVLLTAGTRMFYASFSTLIAETTEGADRDRWYGLVGISQSIAASASGFVASLLISSTGLSGFRTIVIATACCLAISAYMMARWQQQAVVDSSERSTSGYSVVLRDTPFLKTVGSNGLFILCSMFIGIALAVYATEALRAPLWIVGVAGVFQTGMVVGLQTRVIRIIKPYRRTRAMLLAGVLWIVSCLLFAIGISVPAMVIIPYIVITVMIFTAAQLFYIPASRALAAEFGPSGLRGRYIAVYELSWGFAAAIGPAFFGVSYDLWPPAPWLLMSLLVLGAMALLRQAERKIPVSKNSPTAVNQTP